MKRVFVLCLSLLASGLFSMKAQGQSCCQSQSWGQASCRQGMFQSLPNTWRPLRSRRCFPAFQRCPSRVHILALASSPPTGGECFVTPQPAFIQNPSTVYIHQHSPISQTPPHQTPRNYHVRFQGKIPKQWIRTSYGGEGNIEIENKAISMDIGQGLTGIHWKTKNFPKDNFEFIVRARRITGEDMTCGMTFPVGNQFASLIVGGWGGSVVGISCIDDKAADENETTKDMLLKHKQWYTVRVRVKNEKLECFIDDQKVVDISTKNRKFSLRGDCESSRPFGVFSFGTLIEIDRLEIIDLK